MNIHFLLVSVLIVRVCHPQLSMPPHSPCIKRTPWTNDVPFLESTWPPGSTKRGLKNKLIYFKLRDIKNYHFAITINNIADAQVEGHHY